MSDYLTIEELGYLSNFTIDSFVDYDDSIRVDLTCLSDDGRCDWDFNVDGDRLPKVIDEAVAHYKRVHLC